MIWLAK